MNSTNRSLGPTSKITATILAASFVAAPLSAFAASADAPNLWFFGSRLIFAQSHPQAGDLAVSTADPGLGRFLAKLGATLSYQSGQHYVIVTSVDHRSIAFSIGATRYLIDGQPQDAPFAVTGEAGDAIIPFYALARALDVTAVPAGGDTVLQPQIADIEAQTDRGRSIVILHGAASLRPQILSASATRTVVRFPGTSSTLPPERDLALPGLSHMSVAVGGSVRNPETTVTLIGPAGLHAGFLPAPDAASAVIAVAPSSVSLRAQTAPSEAPQSITVVPVPALPSVAAPTTAAQPVPVAVTGLTEYAGAASYVLKIAITGAPSYRWRILNDGRFYVDIHGAMLATPVRDEAPNDARVTALRLRANGTPDAPNVRLALTLAASPAVAIASDAAGLTLTVGGTRTAFAPRQGDGRVGDAAVSVVAPPPGPVAPVAIDANAAWKFSPIAPHGNRLIVIDPGHGGSDSGAEHNGLTEKVLTLDIARRLRTLLIARGWQVKMTRDSDVDVYQANDSAHDELQARCDIANAAGARMFVSIHINSFTTSELQGTTTYYYHPQDAIFAGIMQSKLIGALGTQNDGAQHANFYVIHHTTMPAILVETAFLSNPDDAARLRNEAFRQSVASAITDGITAYASGSRPMPVSATTDTSTASSFAPPVRSATPHTTLVRSASSTDDDLSQ